MPRLRRRHSGWVTRDDAAHVRVATGPTSVRVRVPATSANLGPGFDALGLALSRYDEATIALRTDAAVVIDITGVGADFLPRDEGHLLLRAMRSAAEHFGLPMTGVEIRMHNAIPQSRGLGSSAATIVAGVAAAWMLHPDHERLDPAAVLAVAAGIEGHPDNVAACVYGGLTISWQGAQGAAAVAVPVHSDIEPVLFLPALELSTSLARGLLPATISHADAAFAAGRSALLIHALAAAPHLLMQATEDRLHQAYRAAAIPESSAALHMLRRAGVPAVISGAGPSVLALCSDPEQIEAAMKARLSPGWSCHRLEVATGLDVALDFEPRE